MSDEVASVKLSAEPSTTDSSRAASPSNGDRTRAPKCKQCKLPNEDLFRDDSDGKLYCEACWFAFYKKKPSPKNRFGGPKAEDLPPFSPVSDETVIVDEYYQPCERAGTPRVFVDKQKCGWSALLKSVTSKSAILMLQLVEHSSKLYVLYSRSADILRGPEANSISCSDYVKLADAKKAFEEAFFNATANSWTDVKGCYTKFVTKGDFTLPQDVKAARRAENESKTKAKEEQRAKALAQRNKVIAEEAIANLEKEGIRVESDEGEKSPAEPPCTPATYPTHPAVAPSNLSSPKASVEAPQAIVTGDAGLGSPAEVEGDNTSPPVKAAEVPSAAPKPAVSLSKVAEVPPAAPSSKLAVPPSKVAEVPPAAPSSKPAVPPSKVAEVPPAAPSSKPAVPPSKAAEIPPAVSKPAEPTTSNQTFDVELEEKNSKVPYVVVGAIAVAALGFLFLRSKRN